MVLAVANRAGTALTGAVRAGLEGRLGDLNLTYLTATRTLDSPSAISATVRITLKPDASVTTTSGNC